VPGETEEDEDEEEKTDTQFTEDEDEAAAAAAAITPAWGANGLNVEALITPAVVEPALVATRPADDVIVNCCWSIGETDDVNRDPIEFTDPTDDRNGEYTPPWPRLWCGEFEVLSLNIGDVSEYNESFAMLTPIALFLPSSRSEVTCCCFDKFNDNDLEEEEEDEEGDEDGIEEDAEEKEENWGLQASTRRTVPVKLLPPPLCRIGGWGGKGRDDEGRREEVGIATAAKAAEVSGPKTPPPLLLVLDEDDDAAKDDDTCRGVDADWRW